MNIFRLIAYVVSIPVYLLGWPIFLAGTLHKKAELNPWDDAPLAISLYLVSVVVTVAWWIFIGYLVSNYV